MEVQEIERRFLLRDIPNHIIWDDELSITQYYIQDGDLVKRLRFTTDFWGGKEQVEYLYKILKGHGEFVEVHEEISLSDARALIPRASKVMNKLRYIYKSNGLKFEVDEYDGISLVTLEVELQDINQEIIFPPEIQELIIMEITGIRELSNANLAKSIK